MAETDPAAAETKAAKKISAAKHKTMGPSKLIVKTVSASNERKGTLVQTKGTGAFSSFKLSKKQAETKTETHDCMRTKNTKTPFYREREKPQRTKPAKKATPKAKKPAAKKPAATKKPKTSAAKKPAAKKSLKKVKKPAAKKKMKRP
uniref:H15 domain-containing protein n=1 Tax=Sinocyclocheilus anshuiensis TaxID=1608454 RepID=A0A671MQZ5_9TELE